MAGLDLGGAGGWEVEIGAGTEADHAETFPGLDGVTGFLPADDPAGDQAGDLADQNGPAGGFEPPGLILIAEVNLQMAGVEKLPGGVVGFFKGAGIGAAVHMDIQHGEKDAHPPELSLTKAGIFGLVDTDDFAVRRADQSQGVGWGCALGIAEKEQQTDQKQTGKSGGNPPSQPKGGSQKGGRTDKEGSCFT